MERIAILAAMGAVLVSGFFGTTALLAALAVLGCVLTISQAHRIDRLERRLAYAEQLLGSKVEVLDYVEQVGPGPREPFWRRLGDRLFGRSR